MEYTKGEWKYNEELRANFSMISGDENIVCGLPNPVPTGNAEQDFLELEEMRANANLIAAAPMMYESLKYFIRDFPRPTVKQYHQLVIYEAAIKALAKAEGK